MSEHIVKRHNKTLLLYHIVCPVKYRKKVFSKIIEKILREICLEITIRYEVNFLEIGTDKDHVHFMIQSVPTYSPRDLVQMIKSITAREIFKRNSDIKQDLWGGHFWTSGYYVNTVGQYGNEEIIRKYVQNQGNNYKQIYRGQLKLFEDLS